MKLLPRVVMIAIAALGMTGCRTFGPAPSARLLPPPAPKAASFDVKEFVAEHNRNAQLVESLQAKTQITASTTKRFSRFSGGAPLTGVMVMERPRNFKLELKADSAMRKETVADIGSTDAEFWFMNPEEKSIYTCKYDELPSTPLAASFQPDWIIDAIGLRVITPEETKSIKVRPGKDGKTTDLVFPPRPSNGQLSTRVITVSNGSREIKAHRLYGNDGKTILAQAETTSYQDISVDDSTDGGTRIESSAKLPKQIRLEWKQEQFVLDVNFKDVQLNSFDPSKRDLVFVQPTIPGYAQVNLATTQPGDESRGETTIRESRPIPDSKSSRGIRLDPPSPDDDDSAKVERAGVTISGAQVRSSSRSQTPAASVPLEPLVRSTGPTAPGSYDLQVADSIKNDGVPAAMSIER